jgi:sugar fermentation stimulation protein A
MKPVTYFTPNATTDPDFAETLAYVIEMGVCLLAYDCLVEPDSMTVDSSVECRLKIIR